MSSASRALWWVAAGSVFWLQPAAAESSTRLESERYQVSLVEDGECCPRQMRFAVSDRSAGTTIELHVSGRIQALRGLHLYGDRLVVEGELPWGGTNLLIANLRSGQQEERIWTYDFALSASGRFLVYRTHYPRAVAPPGRRSILLVYDLARSPEENRDGEREDYPCANQGLPVFPEKNAFQRDYCIAGADDRIWASPPSWSPDEERIAFFECTADWERCSLVLVDVGDFSRPPRIWRQLLDLSPYLRREGLHQYTGQPGDPVHLSVRSLGWKDGRTIVAELHPESGVLSPIEFELP